MGEVGAGSGVLVGRAEASVSGTQRVRFEATVGERMKYGIVELDVECGRRKRVCGYSVAAAAGDAIASRLVIARPLVCLRI